MAINVEELLLTVRDLLTELPESVIFSRDSLLGMVKPAIAQWQDATNEDPQRRQNFIVESDPITIAAGVADLSAQVDAKGFRLEFVKENDIALTVTGYSSQTPNYQVKLVNSLDRLMTKGRQDKFYHLAYLSGTKLTLRTAGTTVINGMAGSLKLRAPVIPADLATMNKPMMYELAAVIADMAKKQFLQQNRGLDVPVK